MSKEKMDLAWAILTSVAKHGLVTVDRLTGPQRTQHLAFCRMVAIKLVRVHTGWSTTAVGQFVGGRHHTTVIHACHQVEGPLAKAALGIILAVEADLQAPAHAIIRGWAPKVGPMSEHILRAAMAMEASGEAAA